MEDTGENSAARLTMKALLEMDDKDFHLVTHYNPLLDFALMGSGKVGIVSRCGRVDVPERIEFIKDNGLEIEAVFNDDFDIERARKEMKMLGLCLDDAIAELKPIPIIPIEEFRRVGETINPFKTKKKSPEWKNKLKSLYRVKI